MAAVEPLNIPGAIISLLSSPRGWHNGGTSFETIAEVSLRLHRENGCLPTKQQIVEAYYGEYVEPVDLFIGFADRPAVFDMPLIATGSEDIYFTVSPSPGWTTRISPQSCSALIFAADSGSVTMTLAEPKHLAMSSGEQWS